MVIKVHGGAARLSDQDAARFLTPATLGYPPTTLPGCGCSAPAGWIKAQFQAPAVTDRCEWRLKEGYADPVNIDDIPAAGTRQSVTILVSTV